MRISKQAVFTGVAGVIIGAFVVGAIRFVTYAPATVHYHANFAVYINGQREAFKSDSYYEENGGSCAAEAMTPEERVHMHDHVSDVVHVHDRAVTWGQLFQNIHWVANDRLIQTPSNLYLADADHPINFFINGHPIQDVTNETIQSKDRLLVDFGTTSDAVLQKEIKAVPSTAQKYNEGVDPASCMGTAKPTVTDRLKHLL